MDMLKRGDKGALNQILHLSEMMNVERAEYKETALIQMKRAKIKVRDYAGDCNCRYHRWQGKTLHRQVPLGWLPLEKT